MIIKNAKVNNNIVSIIIEDEKIKHIDLENNFEKYNDNNIINANYNYVISGIIDPHTHMRDPGLTHKEDFESGSKACIRGGVTTFFDMPNTIPNTITKETLLEKKKLMINKSFADYGFHFGGVKSNNSDEIKNIVNLIASTKIFFNASTGNMLVDDDIVLEQLFESSKLITVHAEAEMTDKAIKIAKKTKKPLYICHVSLEREINSIKKAKDEGIEVYAEATPHHIFMNIENINDSNKHLLIMKPELKTKKDNKAIIEAIKSGIIDTIGTDHAPHLIKEKEEKTVYGIPSIENSLELMLNMVEDNTITIEYLSKIMTENSAKIFNIKNKGKLEKGYDADLVIVDLNNKSTIKESETITKANWCPYIGYKRGGRVVTTILRGNIVYEYKNNKDIFYEKKGKEVEFN